MLMMVTNLKAINHPRYVRFIKLLAALSVPQTYICQFETNGLLDLSFAWKNIYLDNCTRIYAYLEKRHSDKCQCTLFPSFKLLS